jgi:hypothetical protein
MDMTQVTQQPAILSRNAHAEGRALGSHHIPRPESRVSTHSGSSPRASQGKASMDIERNTRPFPDKFALSASREPFLTSSSRMASIPVPLPSHLTMGQPVSSTSTSPGSSDSHTSIPSLQTSAPGSEPATDTLSSSSCAAAIAIAAHAAAADSTPQATPRAALSLSPFSPTYNHLSCSRQRVHTAPQQGATSVEALDASSLDVLSDGLDAPPPSMKRASNHPASLTPGFPSFRTTPSLSAPTPFPTKFSIEGVSARLSPAIISRQPQHPILSLPPISPTSSPAIDPSRLRSRSLRSVPALPMQGSDDQEPAEHDNADLDDLDEEDEGVADGDEDAEEGTPEAELPDTTSEDGESTSGPHSSGASESHPGNLPAIVVTPLDMSFLGANKSSTIRQEDKTPKVDQGDYFNSKIPESNYIQSTDPRQLPTARPSATTPTVPASTPTFSVLTPAWATPGSRALLSPTTPRSGMYHQASRSMSDMAEILRQNQTPEMVAKTPKSPSRDPVREADTAVLGAEEPDSQLGPSIRRRLSMPTFGPSTAPPPYPEFRFGERGLIIQPRDEEGCECLPHYTNDIYLRAIMPRKMEFSAPGVQARDRKWRRILCILEGTAFRVYRCPPTATGKGLIGNLWEKTVGVGDISAPATPENPASAKVKGVERERDARQTKFDGVDNTSTSTQPPASPPSQPGPSHPHPQRQPSNDSDAQSSPSSTRSRLIHQHFRRKNRASSAASDGSSMSHPEFQARRSFSAQQQNTPDSSPSQGASSLMSGSSQTSRTRIPSNPATPMLNSPRTPRPPRIKRRHLWVDDPEVPLPQEQNLLHSYALHNAESGLGTDYVKRQNVIRIRMEGEQFLLQARDVASVVDWIEVRLVARAGRG